MFTYLLFINNHSAKFNTTNCFYNNKLIIWN